MALSSQIDAAAIAARAGKPSRADGFVDARAHAILSGASDTGAAHDTLAAARTARLLTRQAPDALEVVGLDPPPHPAAITALLGADALDDILHALTRGEQAAREAAQGLTRIEAEAARAALQARREGR